MNYQPEPGVDERNGNGHGHGHTTTTKTEVPPRRAGRARSPEIEKQREWVNAQLDAGNEVTGSMLDKEFSNTDRNGARLVASVKKEREKNDKN